MIFHLAPQAEWEDAGTYRPASLTEDGFIHCSTASQLLGVANDLYAGRDDLILLTIDPELLSAPVVYEDCYETGQRFPHIYGPIDAEALMSSEPFPTNENGVFTWDRATAENG